MLSLTGLEEIQEIHKTYEHCEFPEEKFDTVFSTTTVYWKVSDEDRKENAKDEEKDKAEYDADEVQVKGDDEDELSKKLESTTIS